ncbi:MAG: cysteine desulfurase [Acidobacteria bacterium]|nr:cysteine desulfurase [Acidobacteriota bacterium]MBU4203000.1 cysteine desulfurase [Acidobacteriota bacterium]
MGKIYFDHMNGTPVHPDVAAVMAHHQRNVYGNPQSPHTPGQTAMSALDKAREQTASLINAHADEIYFTSSGSESNNFALTGLASANQKKGRHIIVSAVEHFSVLHPLKRMEKAGFSVTEVQVDRTGKVDPDDVKKALRDDTVLVSVMLANGEVGTIQPIRDIAGLCREKEVILHTDAVAAAGNMPVDVRALGVDALSLAANPFYGPKGSAALFLRKGVRIRPFIEGGIQEGGRRAGTENLAGIVGMGEAAAIAFREMDGRMNRMKALRDGVIERLPRVVDHVHLTGHPVDRLPHHASFCVEFIEGEAMLLSLDMKGIAASSGSACMSKALKASHVLLAMGYDHALAQGSLVFSFIENNAEEDTGYFLDVFPPIVERLRGMSPLYAKYLEENKNVQ